MAASSNMHIVDQLADVRAEIKTLGEREAELKAQISAEMGAKDSLGGDQWIAFQTLSTRKGGIDDKAMKAAGIDVDRFRKADVTVYSLKVERRVLEEAD